MIMFPYMSLSQSLLRCDTLFTYFCAPSNCLVETHVDTKKSAKPRENVFLCPCPFFIYYCTYAPKRTSYIAFVRNIFFSWQVSQSLGLLNIWWRAEHTLYTTPWQWWQQRRSEIWYFLSAHVAHILGNNKVIPTLREKTVSADITLYSLSLLFASLC